MKSILVVFGTRPEAIKMAPVVQALRELEQVKVEICVTGQHKEMLHDVLSVFTITPDYDLSLMRPNQGLVEITTAVLTGINTLFLKKKYDIVLVHGDTTTTLSTSLAAFYHKIPVGHIEAGLRTYDIHSPWPEELNRRVTTLITSYHFAPTAAARLNLLGEGIHDQSIIVTGNTVIDALFAIKKRIETDQTLHTALLAKFSYLQDDKKIILVTMHRRENFGKNLEQTCSAIQKIAQRSDVQIIYPVHFNPNVRGPVKEKLSDIEHVFLIEPQQYVEFVYLMLRADIILTDSGGVQEEAPSLGKPVLVTRDTTERPEAIEAGTVKLVGTEYDKIISTINLLLDDPKSYQKMANAKNPYGDGTAARRICEHIRCYLWDQSKPQTLPLSTDINLLQLT